MKLYTFNPSGNWDDKNALVVVAENQNQAIEIYRKIKRLSIEELDIEEHDIVPGLIVQVFGYGAVDINAEVVELN